MFYLQILTIVVAGLTLLIVLSVLYKTRKIHGATFRLLKDVGATQQEITVLFAQLQALSALEKRLSLPHGLPPLRGWAGSPDFLLTLTDIVLQRKPVTVVECSSGASTLVIARCLQLAGSGHLYSLEHDKGYAEKTVEMLKHNGVSDWATVLYAPLVTSEDGTHWYDDTVLPESLGIIEMLVVDGPPHDTAPLARLPALPRLLPRLASDSVVILDDAVREAEQTIIQRWLAFAPEFELTYLYHEKGCALLERK